MAADFELERVISGGGDDSADAADELAARYHARDEIRGIDPQAKLNAHHCGQSRRRPGPEAAVRAIALPRAASGRARGATAA